MTTNAGIVDENGVAVRDRWSFAAVSTTWYVLAAVVLLVVVFTVIGPEARFVSVTNLQAIGRNSAGLLLLAIGLAFVLGAGHIDLSVGANLVLSSVVAAKTVVLVSGGSAAAAAGEYTDTGLAIVAGLVAGMVAGMLVGLFNGLLVTRLRINSFVVTLGTMGVATGLAQVITDGANVPYLPPSLQSTVGMRTLLAVPVPLVVGLVVGAVAAGVLAWTRFGRHTLAIGSSASGSRRAGVRVEATATKVFVLCGLMAGVAGFLDITRFGTTAISGHETSMLQALSAVIIGGTSLFGGRASVVGAMSATFIPTVLLAGFVMVGVGSFYQNIAIGLVLIAAVWIDGVRRGQLVPR
ncbi:ABC transporter permease [Jiangella sp. DSM 45060]|uniref:ABC transporter permease n=1 Tax=Jiangella sp. DSM 45060 TaxID=1798224 RepID=UPI00087C2895|nr:ABC transporter permease [Jiangella sp. DSM 45060]SDS44560.1 monosaccharide ABC transporter membrane protein, CUT2 family [Jiangella sp. DSM 45060]